MAEPITVRLTGVNPSTVHLHLDMSSDNEEVLARLTMMEDIMSQMDSTLTALFDRVNVDVEELRRQVTELSGLVDTATANDAADAAANADLTAQRDALLAEIEATMSRMQAYDVDPSFPAQPADDSGEDVPPVPPNPNG